MQKPITRRTVLLRRDRMPDAERVSASNVIGDQVMQLLARVPVGDVLALYAAKGTEVEIDQLVEGKFAIREPRADAPSVELATIAAFIIPGLAFDRAGGRIGWGRGYYDATLAAANPQALRIGLAFECQLVESVARDPHDVPLHYVVTEAAVYRGANA